MGNDVVDLGDAEVGPGARHRRFDERVFSTSERERIASAPDPEALRWTFWAAKESAFKALVRLDGGLRFHPIRFEVDLAAGVVTAGGRVVRIAVDRSPERVHAVATDPQSALEPVLGIEEVEGADPGDAVRALARRLLGDPYRLVERGRIPWAVGPGGRWPVSLSHHGRFAAVAALLGPHRP